jgi:hypothetical protein
LLASEGEQFQALVFRTGKVRISETIEIIAAAEGKPPKGWLSPWVWNF